MLVSRPLNRRVRQLSSYRPSSAAPSHFARRFRASQRSQFSTSAFAQASYSASEAAASPFYTFVMHRLNAIVHTLSSASPASEQSTSASSSSSLSTLRRTSIDFTTPARISPNVVPTPTTVSNPGFQIASNPWAMSGVMSHVLNAAQRASTGARSLEIRDVASTSSNSGPSLPSLRKLFSEARESNQPKKMPSFQKPRYQLDRGEACIPHPEKKDRNPDVQRVLCSTGCGEDSLFTGRNALCVADGVGGWGNTPGADSAKVSRLLTHYCSLKIDENRRDEVHSHPTHVVKHAIEKTQSHKIMGTATFCLVVFEGETAYTYNIGDSGYILIRDGTVVKRSKETTWAFNAPEQIGYPPRSSSHHVKKAFTDEFQVKSGDIFVLMTDGVLDNLFEEELLEIVNKDSSSSPQSLADKIAKNALHHSRDKTRYSPFSKAAESYNKRYPGGKEDDIAVVVGVVSPAEGETDVKVKSRL